MRRKERREASLPCAGAYVCDPVGGGGAHGKGDGWVEEVVDLGMPEMVLQVESAVFGVS